MLATYHFDFFFNIEEALVCFYILIDKLLEELSVPRIIKTFFASLRVLERVAWVRLALSNDRTFS